MAEIDSFLLGEHIGTFLRYVVVFIIGWLIGKKIFKENKKGKDNK